MDKAMSIWGSTDDWAGTGPHKTVHMDGSICCSNGKLERIECNKGPMEMFDKDIGELLETWQCTECHKVWFKRPGMIGFFMIQPISKDDFR